MDDRKEHIYIKHLAQEAQKNKTKLELRCLQLTAYSSVMRAVRATGRLNEKRKEFIGNVREFFDISDERHAAESRRVTTDPRLCRIAECLHGRDTVESWRTEGFGIFPRLPPFHRRSGSLNECLTKEAEPPPALITLKGLKIEDVSDSEEFKTVSTIWKSKVKKVHKKVQTSSKVTMKYKEEQLTDEEIESGSDEKVKQEGRERSPDITEAPPLTPVKNNHKIALRTNSNSIKKARGAKRKIGFANRISPHNVEPPIKVIKKGVPKHSTKPVKLPKVKHAKIKFVRKRPPESESEEAVSSDEEITHLKTTSPSKTNFNINTSGGRGRGLSRVRGRGVSSRGRGGRSRMSLQSSRTHENRSSPNPEIGSSDRIVPTTPTKTLKVLKPKKPKTVSLSRRKSRLKEKEDDEMQMEWNDYGYDDDAIIMSNKHIPIKKRKHFPGESCKLESNMGDGPLGRGDEIGLSGIEVRDKRENGELLDQAYSSSDNRDRENDIHNSTDALGRCDVSRPSSTLSGEETDSASEKGSVSGSRTNDSPNNSNNSSNTRISPSPPPVRQKQRLKTPLTGNSPSGHSQLPRITLPPPVFSTSLSSVNKKRPKHISVVDSLNLHLPTTATASSLAASSSARRPSIGGSSSTGCSIFANSQALLANSRGGPGILQQQRKAHPHILANSKVQRNFIPTTNNNNNNSNTCNNNSSNVSSVSMCVSVGGNTISLPSNNSIVSSAGGTIMSPGVHQVQTTVIPSISSTPAAMAVQLPHNAGSALGIGGAIPLGSVPVSRAPNIIFLQKATSPPIAVTSSITSNSLPVKAASRAVILRRAQIPRQGNVMILDVQKNQVVNAGHVPQFLQTTRILTGPNELSVLNLQGGTPQRKILQAHQVDPAESNVLYGVPSGQPRKPKIVGSQQIIVTSAPSNTTENCRIASQNAVISGHHNPNEHIVTTSNSQDQGDSQLAQIEAELMQMNEMEQEMVYEEEVVTTTSSSNSQELRCNENSKKNLIPSTIEPKDKVYNVGISGVNAVNAFQSGSSSTASEGEISFSTSLNNTPEGLRQKTLEVSLTQQLEVRQMSDALTKAIVSSNINSVQSKDSNRNNTVTPNEINIGLATNHGSTNLHTEGEDIFQAALKSSGIVFAEQQFFGAEEEISTNVEEGLQAQVNNMTTVTTKQDNGTTLQ